MKKGFIIAAVILIAAGLALLAGAAALSGFDSAKLDTSRYETVTYEIEEPFDKIKIVAKEADVLLLPSEDGVCRVVCFEKEKVRHTAAVEDGTLTIGADDRREWYERLTLFARSPSVTVYLPWDHGESLTVEGGTGDVTIPASFSFGRIDVAVGTGDVTCRASAEERIGIRTSTGNVSVEEIHAGEIGISVSTGRVGVSASECGGAVSIRTGTGKTALTDLTCRALDVEGSTGGVTLKNVVASDNVTIGMGTGGVRFENCDAGELTVRTSTGDVTGTLRTEKVFNARSSAGSVRVPDTASGGRCEITTSTGRIEISLSPGANA